MRALCRLIIVSISVFVMACSQQPTSMGSNSPPPVNYQKWTTAELQGSTWQLVDDTNIENMIFYPNGYLPITLGIKSPSGPIIMAPMFHWAIDDSGVLVINDNKNNSYKKIYKLSADESRVTVQVNGRLQYYNKVNP